MASFELTNEQWGDIYSAVGADNLCVIDPTIDEWDKPFVLFGDWRSVSAFQKSILEIAQRDGIELGAEGFPRDKYDTRVLDSLFDDWGFEDEHYTCSNCNRALRSESPFGPANYHLTECDVWCEKCTDADDYIADMARKHEWFNARLANPTDNGLAEIGDLDLWGDEETKKAIRALRKALPKFQIVYLRMSRVTIWARVNPEFTEDMPEFEDVDAVASCVRKVAVNQLNIDIDLDYYYGYTDRARMAERATA